MGSGSTELITLRSRQLTPEYVYLLARSDAFRNHAIQSMSGATGRQRVRTDAIESFMLSIPPTSLLGPFHDSVEPMFTLSLNLFDSTRALRSARDLLLPRLISGEVDVSELNLDVSDVVS